MPLDTDTLGRAYDLESLIHCVSGRQIRDLRVFQHERGLVLRGLTSTYYAKQMAQHVAMETTGLRILDNQIEVTVLGPAVEHPNGFQSKERP